LLGVAADRGVVASRCTAIGVLRNIGRLWHVFRHWHVVAGLNRSVAGLGSTVGGWLAVSLRIAAIVVAGLAIGAVIAVAGRAAGAIAGAAIAST
jgi:hypothetical protein